MSLLQDREHLLEQEGHLVRVALLARDRDLVASHQDLGVEGRLNELQQLVALAEEGHHGRVPRNLDLHPRGLLHQPGGHPIARPPRRWKCR